MRTVGEKQRRSRLLLPLFCIFYFKCEEKVDLETSFLREEYKIDETVKNVTKQKKRTQIMTRQKKGLKEEGMMVLLFW